MSRYHLCNACIHFCVYLCALIKNILNIYYILNLYKIYNRVPLFAFRLRYVCGHMWDAAPTGEIITGDFKCFEVGLAALPISIGEYR